MQESEGAEVGAGSGDGGAAANVGAVLRAAGVRLRLNAFDPPMGVIFVIDGELIISGSRDHGLEAPGTLVPGTCGLILRLGSRGMPFYVPLEPLPGTRNKLTAGRGPCPAAALRQRLPLRGLRSLRSLRPLPTSSASSLCDNLLPLGPAPYTIPGVETPLRGRPLSDRFAAALIPAIAWILIADQYEHISYHFSIIQSIKPTSDYNHQFIDTFSSM